MNWVDCQGMNVEILFCVLLVAATLATVCKGTSACRNHGLMMATLPPTALRESTSAKVRGQFAPVV